MRVTIREVARRAGVSKTSVSFAFNDPSRLSRATLRRIMGIAEELGYSPDPVARTLATRSSAAIGFLLPQAIPEAFRNPYTAELLQGIGQVCQREGLSLSLIPPLEGLLSRAVRTAMVSAFILLGVSPDRRTCELLERRRLPFVTIDGDGGALNVGIDDERAAEALMEHVLALGHRDIEVIGLRSIAHGLSDGRGSRTAERRLAGFRRALRARGLSLGSRGVKIHVSEGSIAAASRAAHRILSRADRPTALVCMSDVSAYGAYQACRDLDLNIPAELSVAGFDDVAFSGLLSPALTTVHQPGFEKGRRAARLAVNLLAGRKCSSQLLPAELVVRGSTAPPADRRHPRGR
jgi:alanine racemase